MYCNIFLVFSKVATGQEHFGKELRDIESLEEVRLGHENVPKGGGSELVFQWGLLEDLSCL